MYRRTMFLLVLATLCYPSLAGATTISLNFGDGIPGYEAFTTIGSYWAGAVQAPNWNDVPMAQQTNLALRDSSGSNSGLKLSTAETFAYAGSAYIDPNVTFANWGDNALMSGHIYHAYSGGPIDLTFHFAAGLAPLSTFDMYMYYNSPVAYTDKFSILDIHGNSLGLSQTGHDTGGGDGSYVLSNGTGGDGNYVKFTGINPVSIASGFIVRVEANGSSDYGIINGLQIDGMTIGLVPEPGALVLLAIGLLGLLAYAWQTRR